MLNERSDPISMSGDRPMRAKRGVQMPMVIAIGMMIAGVFAAAPAQPNYIRMVLESSSLLGQGRLAEDGEAQSILPHREGVGPIEARRLNAAIPFAVDAGVPAQPFLAAENPTDRDRAVDCLALAAMAEAGSGEDGQRAVIQVILNRVRHPAFAKTICGVVFEGSYRSTGCQFTFTCDGALARRHSAAAWSRARARAIEAIEGRVFAPVGLATHYHTDWVHPYWSASLIKLARVDTHLFFRWPGRWGSPAALNMSYRGGEPAITQLAYLSTHAGATLGALTNGTDSEPQVQPSAADVVVRNEDGGAFILLTGVPSAERARDLGRSVCVNRTSCKVFGWFDRASIPSGYPVPANLRAKLGFSYFRSSHNGETALYDCSRFSDVANDNCLPPPPRSRQQLQADPKLAATVWSARTATIPDRSGKLADTSAQP